MQYAFYPGCVAKGGAPELYNATLAVTGALGIELEELREAACTGAGVLSERNPELADTLNARTFAMAEKLGLPPDEYLLHLPRRHEPVQRPAPQGPGVFGAGQPPPGA